MDWRMLFKNVWLAVTLFVFFGAGCIYAGKHYEREMDANRQRHQHEISQLKAECEQRIEHIQREAAENANEAIQAQVLKNQEKLNETYKELADLQRRFTDNRTLIKRLHESQTVLCSRGALDAETCNRQLRECERILGNSADTIGRSIEILQQQKVLSGRGEIK